MSVKNNLRFLSSLVWMRLMGKSLPLSVIFNLTNNCNCRCAHCYAEYYNRESAQEMSTEDIKALILDLRNNGCLRISFSGGEPLLRDDLCELIDYASGLGLSVTLNSNGLLVPKFLNVLKKLDSLAISLDGRPQHHNLLRGEGSGEKALLAIKMAREKGIKVHLNMVLNKYNLEDIDYVLDLAKVYGLKVEFNIIIPNIFGKGLALEKFKPADEDLKRALLQIISKKKSGEPVLFSSAAYQSVLHYWNEFVAEYPSQNSLEKGIPECPAGKFFALIDADGVLWACPHLIGKIPALNALKEGVAKAWDLAGKHSCQSCYQVYHHEFSLLIRLHPATLWNYFLQAIGKAK